MKKLVADGMNYTKAYQTAHTQVLLEMGDYSTKAQATKDAKVNISHAGGKAEKKYRSIIYFKPTSEKKDEWQYMRSKETFPSAKMAKMHAELSWKLHNFYIAPRYPNGQVGRKKKTIKAMFDTDFDAEEV